MALSFDPLYPVAGTEVELSLTAASVSGNVVVWELTGKPSASTLTLGFVTKPGTFRRQKLATPIRTTTDTTATATTHRTTPVTALMVAELEAEHDLFTPDVAGEYTLAAHEINAYAGAPSFVGDPAGELRWVYVTKQTGTLHVGELMDLPIVTEVGDGATLRVTVVDETIRDAEMVEPTSEVGRLASLDSAVVAAVDALIGQSPANVGTDLQTGVNELGGEFMDHRLAGTWHLNIDSANEVRRDYAAKSQETAIAKLNEIRDRLLGHLEATSAASPRVHTNDDYTNRPVTPKAKDLASATVLLADCRERCYERHRVLGSGATPAIHTSASGDTTNALSAPSLLDTAIVAVLDAIVALNPSAAAGEPEGAADLAHRFGFKLAV